MLRDFMKLRILQIRTLWFGPILIFPIHYFWPSKKWKEKKELLTCAWLISSNRKYFFCDEMWTPLCLSLSLQVRVGECQIVDFSFWSKSPRQIEPLGSPQSPADEWVEGISQSHFTTRQTLSESIRLTIGAPTPTTAYCYRVTERAERLLSWHYLSGENTW